jgi:hypothetical protein
VLAGNQDIDTPIEANGSASRLIDITSVNEDGTFAGTVTFESHETTIVQGGDFAADLVVYDEYAALEGLSLTGEFDADGRANSLVAMPGTTLTAEQEAAVDEIVHGDRGVLASLPDEPVGAGAEWTAPVEYLGGSFPGEFALSSLVEGAYVIEFSLDLDSSDLASTDLPGRFQTAEGTVSLTGTVEGDAKDPHTGLRRATALFDVTYTGPDGELTIDIETSVTQTVAPA